MNQFKAIFYLLSAVMLLSCKSKTRLQEDSIYSRHLQQRIQLSVVTTPLPDKKEEMNLLLFIADDAAITSRLKNITDSLYRKKQLQPLTIVAFKGKAENYGTGTDDKKVKQFNDFIINELYPFCKKKVGLRKFSSVAICGSFRAATNAWSTSWNHDEKIGRAGLFYPEFTTDELTDIASSRMRPKAGIWINAVAGDSTSISFKTEMDRRATVQTADILFEEPLMSGNKKIPTTAAIAGFLLWAFGK